MECNHAGDALDIIVYTKYAVPSFGLQKLLDEACRVMKIENDICDKPDFGPK